MNLPPKLVTWLKLFWMFLKVNLLTTSGPTSIGLLYKETVGSLMSESQFIEAVGFSNVLPGSEALKLAMFIGYAAAGLMGTVAALVGAILPPTLIMLTVASLLSRFQGQSWMQSFVRGMAPAIGVLVAIVAWQIFRSDTTKPISRRSVLIAVLAFIALALNLPAPLVLLGGGILGVFLFS